MAIALWIVQGLLGLIFVMTGSFKLFQTREKVIASGGTWAEDFSPGVIKAIAALELLSGLSLIVAIIAHLRGLACGAAGCVAVIMAGSIVVHVRRMEWQHAVINAVFLAMAGMVVLGQVKS